MRGYGYGFHHRMGRDPDLVAGKGVDKAVLRRVLTFARAYRKLLVVFVATILAGSIVGILPPLDRKSTRLNSSHIQKSRMPSSA